VLYNASTRQTAIWYRNNNLFAGGAFGPTLPSGWGLAAVGDFNADSKPDYVLYQHGVKSTFASGLSYPYALAFDSAGNLFVTDWGNPGVAGYVYKYTSDGVRSTFAQLGAPLGLAFDSSGNLLVMDEDSGNIYKFTPGGARTIFAKIPGLVLDQTGFLAFQPNE
jgi:DNA-binding beta-propeller fold protein YncE